MRSNRFVLLGVAAVIATVSAIGGGSAGGVGRRQACISTPVVVAAEAPAAVPVVVQENVPANRKPDDAAVRKTLDGLASAFQKGDAKGVAAQWTRVHLRLRERGLARPQRIDKLLSLLDRHVGIVVGEVNQEGHLKLVHLKER